MALFMGTKISRQRYRFTAAGTYYIDLFRSLSAQERKLFRQGQIAHVMGGLLKDSDDETVVEINVAPDTWATRTAWRRGKRLYNKHIKEGLEGVEAGKIKPKYHDFKVTLNNAMGGSPLLPVDAANNTIPSGEWLYSNFHSEDVDWSDPNLLTNANREADTFEAMLCGQHVGSPTNWTRISLLQSWIESRAFPDDYPSGQVPITLAADPLTNLFDEADAADEIMESLRLRNDEPPYDEDTHFGMAIASGSENNLQRVAFAATQSGAGQVVPINGFSAMCGLVEVKITHGSAGNDICEILFDVAMKGDKI